MPLLEKLIDFILGLLEDILPFVIIDHYEKGVRLRFGKNGYPELEPGFNWKIPFADKIHTVMIKTTTMPLREQTLTTKDNVTIVVKAVIKYEIKDAKQILLEVNDAYDAVADMTQGIIRDFIIDRNYVDCNSPDLGKDITLKARQEAVNWGIKIRTITITDLGKMTSIRLLNTPLKTEE